jgi:hypothetical protein
MTRARRARSQRQAVNLDEASADAVVAVPYLTIAGRGAASGQLYDAKVSALYSVVYAIKLALAHRGRDFPIPPLEAFWAGHQGPDHGPDGPRFWKLGIRAPGELAAHDVVEAIAALTAKGKDPLVKDVVLESFEEHDLVRFPEGEPAPLASSLL